MTTPIMKYNYTSNLALCQTHLQAHIQYNSTVLVTMTTPVAQYTITGKKLIIQLHKSNDNTTPT